MAKRGPKPRPVRLRPRWLEQYRAGLINLAELARRAGVSVTTAYKELKRRGVDTSGQRGGPRTPRRTAQWAVALYRRGLSLRLVARQVGLSHEGVRRLLRHAGVTSRPAWERFPLRAPDGRPVRLRHFGPRLQALRRAAGCSRAELATKSGLHQLTIAALEAGRHVPQWGTLVRLARALGVGLEAFGIRGH
jgi:DNA-binding XRE family transcriptional regulator